MGKIARSAQFSRCFVVFINHAEPLFVRKRSAIDIAGGQCLGSKNSFCQSAGPAKFAKRTINMGKMIMGRNIMNIGNESFANDILFYGQKNFR